MEIRRKPKISTFEPKISTFVAELPTAIYRQLRTKPLYLRRKEVYATLSRRLVSEIADKMANSSVIVIDGTFIAMLVSVSFVVLGTIILIKTIKHK